jgi:hypothetical protein
MPETDKSIVIAEIDEIKWQSETPDQISFIVSFFVVPCHDEVQGHWQKSRNLRSALSNTGQSVLKSKGLYQTGGHFTGLVRRSDGISFSLPWSSRTLTKKSQSQKRFNERKYQHYRNNLIGKKDSYLIPPPPSWDDRSYSYGDQLYPSDTCSIYI